MAAPKVQRLIIALEPPERETNEMRHLGPTTSWPMRPMYEYLLGHEATSGKLIPQLATDWKLEPDGATFRLKLRSGVPFQGGNGTFSAADVQTIEHAATEVGAAVIVTTEKDAVRLATRPRWCYLPMTVAVEPEAVFSDWLAARLQDARERRGTAA